MQYDQFVQQVQARARLASNGEAVRAIHATLETLGERLPKGEAEDLAAQLPEEIGFYLRIAKPLQKYSLDEFYQRVAEREKMDLPIAIHHARVVMGVVSEAASRGEIGNVRGVLPPEFAPLLEPGREGETKM